MKPFRLLEADEIECRVKIIKETGLSLLLYKTARTDASMLDEAIGMECWQDDFKLIDGVLFGGIGIKTKEMNDWVWKWDAGVESATEKEKGRASDAFKRAGFKWGIGRELYTAPKLIWIPASKCKITSNKCYDEFIVSKISYTDKREICELQIVNKSTGELVYTWNDKHPVKRQEQEHSHEPKRNAPAESAPGHKCSACGTDISEKVYNYSNSRMGSPLCMDCQKMR